MFALGLLILIAAMAAIFWPSEKGSIGQPVRYSDGTTLTLKEVTYGTVHRYRSGGFRERIVSLLPRKLAAKYASRRDVLRTDRPSVTFWFDRRGTPAMYGDLVLCDENGFGIVGDYLMMRLDPPNSTMEGWAFEAWPRRQRTFTVRVYERGSRYGEATLLGEFTVRNPKPDNYPVWTAPPLPMRATNGDLSVNLFDLTAGVGHGSLKWKPALNPTVSQTRAGFRVERNGRPTKEWGIATVEASDATGNLIRRLGGTSSEPDAEFAELHPHLWPSESAWKLRVGFSQRSNFVASELWTLRGIPLTGTDLTNTLLTQTNLQGALLQYTGQQRGAGSGDDQRFNFRVTPGRTDYRVTLVRAVDDNGREATVGGSFEGAVYLGFGSKQDWGFGLRVNTNATSLDLTLALHQTRYVEFLARPQIISTNGTGP